MGLVTVQTFNSRVEADIAKGLLSSVGIFAVVMADDQNGQRPSMGMGAELRVQEAEAEKAKRLLASRPSKVQK